MKVELKDIEFEDAYVIEEFGSEKKSFFTKNYGEIDPMKYESEDTDYMIQMKIKLYTQKMDREENIKALMINTQKNNIHRIGAYTTFIIIFSLIIVLLEKYFDISIYTSMDNISIMDMRSVGALFVYPMVGLLIIGIIVCLAWIIVLFKRCAVTEDPHDRVIRRREAIIKKCDTRILKYKDEVYRLQMKLLHLK